MKRTYKLRDWSEYNAALVKRGSLTLWLSDEVIAAWKNIQKTGKPGASKDYSDLAIQTLLNFTIELQSTLWTGLTANHRICGVYLRTDGGIGRFTSAYKSVDLPVYTT